jgi:hypothetical protein
VSVEKTREAIKGPRYARAASVLTGDNYTDRALWQLSLILAEIAASTVHCAENGAISDGECEDGDERNVPDEPDLIHSYMCGQTTCNPVDYAYCLSIQITGLYKQ